METIIEGNAKIQVEIQKIVDKKMPTFYNPIMSTNRDFTLLVLYALEKETLDIIDPLAGTGIRSIRILKELPETKIRKIVVNDIKPDFKEIMTQNLELNNINNTTKIEILNLDANTALNTQGHFDYIDLDPFGTPNPYLDSAIRALKRNGILSICATDTSSLCGSYKKACKRKYWATPSRDELMHEFGTRILIRKVQLLGAHHERALTPLLSYATDHYIKVFFKSKNSKSEVDEILKQHKYYNEKGPIWLGPIQDEELIIKMIDQKTIPITKKTEKLLTTLKEEAQIKEPFYCDTHKYSSEQKHKTVPKINKIIEKLEDKGYLATKTHFNQNAIKTNAPQETIHKIIDKLTEQNIKEN
ncbi:MAG: tRNA (guanine(26)-N(2))-dimethyltransferase [Candidatus Woesearchaeota archaeon]